MHRVSPLRAKMEPSSRQVLAGAPSPIDIADGLRNVKIIAAAVRSVESGKVVELNS